MNNTPPASLPNRHLGLRITVGVVGLAFLALFLLLGQVAMKQSATNQALETHDSPQGQAKPAAVRE